MSSGEVTYKSYADAIIAAIEEAAKVGPGEVVDAMVNDARDFAPVRTGHLRDSIHRENGTTSNVAYFVVSAFYWLFVEFGTRFMRAHPFITPAYERNVHAMIDAFLTRLRKAAPHA